MKVYHVKKLIELLLIGKEAHKSVRLKQYPNTFWAENDVIDDLRLEDKDYPTDAHVTKLIQAERQEQGYDGPDPGAEMTETFGGLKGALRKEKVNKGPRMSKQMKRALVQDC